ncbi:hypothetical protein O6R05_04600 [Peptoniphilus equinus]|uniref:Uncharacterized protein n=1 Tax=Peptoniphilus equinus TaxID=3016343 RepID=A0ABY7QR79_9FIRM|nr:hypothetical protein [Peptoniphilus equinus]WBW49294.1 hypothetical protein O6R05_04600 [Peptoniphilus equinus]
MIKKLLVLGTKLALQNKLKGKPSRIPAKNIINIARISARMKARTTIGSMQRKRRLKKLLHH